MILNFIKEHIILTIVIVGVVTSCLTSAIILLNKNEPNNSKTSNDKSSIQDNSNSEINESDNNEEIKEEQDNSVKINDNQNWPSSEYLGKYVGTGSDNASGSYIQLFDNGIARVSVNHCEGWTTYSGKYRIDTLEYTDDLELYIDSFSIIDGVQLDMPEVFAFQINQNQLFTSIGYLGTNNYDCGVQTTFIKQ